MPQGASFLKNRREYFVNLLVDNQYTERYTGFILKREKNNYKFI